MGVPPVPTVIAKTPPVCMPPYVCDAGDSNVPFSVVRVPISVGDRVVGPVSALDTTSASNINYFKDQPSFPGVDQTQDSVDELYQVAMKYGAQERAVRGDFYPWFTTTDVYLRPGQAYSLAQDFAKLPLPFQALLEPVRSDPTLLFVPDHLTTVEGDTIPVLRIIRMSPDGMIPVEESPSNLIRVPGYPVSIALDDRLLSKILPVSAQDLRTSEGRSDAVFPPVKHADPALQLLTGFGTPSFSNFSSTLAPLRRAASLAGGEDNAAPLWRYGAIVDGTGRSKDLVDSSGHPMMAGALVAVPMVEPAAGWLGARTAVRVAWNGTKVAGRFALRVLTVDALANAGSWAIKKWQFNERNPDDKLWLFSHNQMVDEDNVLPFGIGSWAVEVTWGGIMAGSEAASSIATAIGSRSDARHSAGNVYMNGVQGRAETYVTVTRWFSEAVESLAISTMGDLVANSNGEFGKIDQIEETGSDGKKTYRFAVQLDWGKFKDRMTEFFRTHEGSAKEFFRLIEYTGFKVPRGRLLSELVNQYGKVQDDGKLMIYTSALFQEVLDKTRRQFEDEMISLGLGTRVEKTWYGPGDQKEVKTEFKSLLSGLDLAKLTPEQKTFLRREQSQSEHSLTWRIKYLEGVTTMLNERLAIAH